MSSILLVSPSGNNDIDLFWGFYSAKFCIAILYFNSVYSLVFFYFKSLIYFFLAYSWSANLEILLVNSAIACSTAALSIMLATSLCYSVRTSSLSFAIFLSISTISCYFSSFIYFYFYLIKLFFACSLMLSISTILILSASNFLA